MAAITNNDSILTDDIDPPEVCNNDVSETLSMKTKEIPIMGKLLKFSIIDKFIFLINNRAFDE